jgi:hypothetical protein
MRLSALHLQRALLLQEVVRAPVGNVRPIRANGASGSRRSAAAPPIRLIELPSCR